MIHRPTHEVELFRDDDCYRVFVDVPGFERDDVDVRWHRRRLVIAAERSNGRPEASSVFHHDMGLPLAVHTDEITATYRDGVLEVELPITNESEPPGLEIPVQD